MVARYDEAADAAHEAAVDAFFKQAVIDGRMSQEERDELMGRTRHGRGRKSGESKDLRGFEDFVTSAGYDAYPEAEGLTERQRAATRVRIDIHLAEMRLTRRHVELYINYPQFTEAELGKAFGVSHDAVNRALARVRKAWPSFRMEPAAQNRDECPALEHMGRIECSDTNPWLDENEIRQRF